MYRQGEGSYKMLAARDGRRMKTQRKRFRILDLSAKTRLIGFAAVAVLIPTTILSAMQCKSLVELEAKTKVAVQENLRQTLQQVSRTLESRFRKLATQDLAGIDPTAFDPTSQSPTIAFLKSRSTIPGDGIVISSNCAANKSARVRGAEPQTSAQGHDAHCHHLSGCDRR